MEKVNEEIPGYVPPAEPPKWFHNGWFSRGFLIIAALFFFMPFMNINCTGQRLATVTGADLLVGTELVPQKLDTTTADMSFKWDEKDYMNGTEAMFEQGDQKKVEPNPFALIAMTGIILSIVFSFFSARVPVIISGGMALLGALCLFFLQIHVNNTVESKIGAFNFTLITFEFTPWYWMCVFLMALAAIFAFVRSVVLRK
jgi:hypothetical protein